MAKNEILKTELYKAVYKAFVIDGKDVRVYIAYGDGWHQDFKHESHNINYIRNSFKLAHDIGGDNEFVSFEVLN